MAPCLGINEPEKLNQVLPMSPVNMNYFCRMVCLSVLAGSQKNPSPWLSVAPCLCLRNDPPRHRHGLSGRGCALQKWGKVSYSEDNIVRHRKSSKACVSRKPLSAHHSQPLTVTSTVQDNLRLDGVMNDSSHSQRRDQTVALQATGSPGLPAAQPETPLQVLTSPTTKERG